MLPARFEYHRASTLDEALGLLARHGEDAKILAGGQSLIPMMKLRFASPGHLIDINAVPGLAGVREDGGVLKIGAMTRHQDVASNALVRQLLPGLAALAGGIGDKQIRAMGTLGGSVANNDPAACYPSAVLALGATVVTKIGRAHV